MSPVYNRIDIKGYRVLGSEHKGQLFIHLTPLRRALPVCVCCGGVRLRSKGIYVRRVRHLDCFGTPSVLLIQSRRYRCLQCARCFVQPLPGVLPGRHSTEPFREHVYRHHHEGIAASSMASLQGISGATVSRIYCQFTQRKAAERLSLLAPAILGIDEHTLHKGQRFATTFCDLKNHKVFDVLPGRSEKDLRSFVASLKGRERVRVVCIDLSSPYRHLIKTWFPNARIVADRFHVIRIILHHFINLCRQIAPQIKNHRGSLALLRMRPSRLSDTQRQRQRDLFKAYPALEPLYTRIQELCALLNIKHQTRKQCRPLAAGLLNFITELASSGFEPLLTLANTLKSWIDPIACMWRFSKNNGITEGFHRKMKLIQRRAYGFRNFHNYRLRVIAHCG